TRPARLLNMGRPHRVNVRHCPGVSRSILHRSTGILPATNWPSDDSRHLSSSPQTDPHPKQNRDPEVAALFQRRLHSLTVAVLISQTLFRVVWLVPGRFTVLNPARPGRLRGSPHQPLADRAAT